MKTAIVHDWLVNIGGAENTLKEMIDIYKDADIYTLIDFLKDRSIVHNKSIKTSFLQKIPLIRQKYRNFLALFPKAIQSFDLSSYDVIISSSHCVAKSIKKHKNQIHISYIYTPVRYAWDLREDYLKDTNLDKGIKKIIANLILDYIKDFDVRTLSSIDYPIAISYHVKDRIKRIYNLDASVIYPPVDTDFFELFEKKENYYLVASRMVPYKKIPLIVEAFNHTPDKKLLVIGNGPELNRVKSIAKKNIEILGYQDKNTLKYYMQRAKAFIFGALEDFGIAPIEAQSTGTPVIAYKKGGVCETIIEGRTGVFFENQSVEDIIKATKDLDKIYDNLNPKEIRQNALRFSKIKFKEEFKTFVEKHT